MPKERAEKSKDKKPVPGRRSHFCLYNLKKPNARSGLESIFPKAYLNNPKRFTQHLMAGARAHQLPSHVPETTFREKVRTWNTTYATPPRTPTTTTNGSHSFHSDNSGPRDQFLDDPEALELIKIIKRWE